MSVPLSFSPLPPTGCFSVLLVFLLPAPDVSLAAAATEEISDKNSGESTRRINHCAGITSWVSPRPRWSWERDKIQYRSYRLYSWRLATRTSPNSKVLDFRWAGSGSPITNDHRAGTDAGQQEWWLIQWGGVTKAKGENCFIKNCFHSKILLLLKEEKTCFFFTFFTLLS